MIDIIRLHKPNLSDHHKEIINDLLNVCEKYEQDSEKEYKLYTSSEYDSNQSLFEFIFNNVDLTVRTCSKQSATIILVFLRYIIDNHINISRRAHKQNKSDDEYFANFLGVIDEMYDCDDEREDDEVKATLSEKILEVYSGYTSNDLKPQDIGTYPKKYAKTLRNIRQSLDLKDDTTPVTTETLRNYFYSPEPEDSMQMVKPACTFM